VGALLCLFSIIFPFGGAYVLYHDTSLGCVRLESSSVRLCCICVPFPCSHPSGDTIPYVNRFMFLNLPYVPVLYLFADRRFISAFTTTCVSFPLSLYRDIHELSITFSFALCGMLIFVASVMFEGRPIPHFYEVTHLKDLIHRAWGSLLGSSTSLSSATTILWEPEDADS
jgi:hypothetical protein